MALTKSSGRSLKHNILECTFLHWSQHIMDKKPLPQPIISAKPSLWASLTQTHLQRVSWHNLWGWWWSISSVLEIAYCPIQGIRQKELRMWSDGISCSLPACVVSLHGTSTPLVTFHQSPWKNREEHSLWPSHGAFFFMSTYVESKPLVQTRWRRQSTHLGNCVEKCENLWWAQCWQEFQPSQSSFKW